LKHLETANKFKNNRLSTKEWNFAASF